MRRIVQSAMAPARVVTMGRVLMKLEQTRFRLAIPLEHAFAFAMGWTDLDYADANDRIRLVMGFLVVDSLEYSEQWRASAEVRKCLEERWPDMFSS